MFTYDSIRNLLPPKKRTLVTEEMVKTINDVAADPLIAEEFKSNFLTFTNIISSGKYSVEEYNNAVHFITLSMLGDQDIDAYSKVFPDRYKRLADRGVSRSKMSSYVSNYKNTALYTQLLTQSIVPTHIVNAPLYQEALNHSRVLMLTAKSEAVQQKAAETILNQLKAPEAAKLEVDISINKGEVVDDYEAMMREVAKQKRDAILAGADTMKITNLASQLSHPVDEKVCEAEIIIEEEIIIITKEEICE